ncbi:MAG: LPS assembly lipoprotein LptE [Pseudomonadota bacterium]
MWWSRRSILSIALLVLASCGFSPVYGPEGIGTALDGRILADEPNSEEDYLLVRRLEEVLGRSSDPAFLLRYRIFTREESQAITTTGDITRYNLIGTVRYDLIRRTDETLMTTGDVQNFTSYSASGSTVDTLSAERDALRRLMVILGDQLVAELYSTLDPASLESASLESASLSP